jgi:prepilin-type N-terminal cleavage/methylation domain-containing protein
LRILRKATRAQRASHRVAGFTLIEIMVVVVIIGLLAAIVVPQVIGHVEGARVAKAKQDIQSFETALTMYRLDNFSYPSTDQGCERWWSGQPIPQSGTGERADIYSACPGIPGARSISTRVRGLTDISMI